MTPQASTLYRKLRRHAQPHPKYHPFWDFIGGKELQDLIMNGTEDATFEPFDEQMDELETGVWEREE